MNKIKLIMFKIIPLVLIIMVIFNTKVFGFENFSTDVMQNLGDNSSVESVDNAIKKVWGTITLILQTLAVLAIILSGVRYMFASADGKAYIKKQTFGLVVGTVLVFGASFIINFIVNVTEEVTNGNTNTSINTNTNNNTNLDINTNQNTNTNVDIIEKPTLNVSNTSWTSKDVMVTISGTPPTGYELQYKLSGGMKKDWTKITPINGNSSVMITDNSTTIVTRYYNKNLDDEIIGEPASITVARIDKINPTIPTSITIKANDANSVTATATGSTDIGSGVEKYQYSINNSTWQDNGTFSGIKSGTSITVYARAVDKVGNVSGSVSNKGTTSSLGQVTMKVTQTPAPTTATNNYVNGNTATTTVTLSHTAVNGYTLQYKLSGGMTKDWTTYTSAIAITENNTTVATRMYNATLDDEGNSANSKTISNIDKINPTIPTSITTKTNNVNSVTATATGSTDVGSGVEKYQYSLDNKTWQDSGTFTGIKSGTSTTVYARAVDKVGKVSGSISNKGTTTSLGAVTITPSITAWTKGNVTITLSHAVVSGYTLQYKIGSGEWTTYSSALTITDNNTTVYGRMYNSTLADEGNSAASKTIANIDKVAPVTPTSVSISAGTNSVTAAATGSSDTLSGFSKYQYSIDNSTWQDSGTFSGIKSGTATTIYARAVDRVGNVSKSKSNKGTTSSLGQVRMIVIQTPAPTTATNNYVNGNTATTTVTLSHTAVSGYTLQYKLSGGMTKDWTTYTSAIAITENNTTVATRMYNATLDDEGNSANSKTISNIDKINPTIPTSITTKTNNVNSVTATATGSTDVGSGVEKYQYSLDNKTWQDSGTFTELSEDITYTIYARAVDKVNRVSETQKITAKVTVEESHKIHFIKTSSPSDCILLESNGHYGMIDTATTWDIDYNSINRYLKKLNVTKLDFLIITHNHWDHIGSATKIINEYKPSKLYLKKYYGNEKTDSKQIENHTLWYESALDAAKNKGTEIIFIDGFEEPYTINLGEMVIDNYNTKNWLTDDSVYKKKISENCNSITSLVTINGLKTYLAADLTIYRDFPEESKKIIDKIGKVDVLKLAHHGMTDGTGVEEVSVLQPDYVVITISEEELYNTKWNGGTLATWTATSGILAKYNNGNTYTGEYETYFSADHDVVVDYTSGEVIINEVD